MNSIKSERTLDSLGLLVGVVIGAGMFALPYAVSRVGVLWGIGYLLFWGAVFAVLHALYGEVVYIVKGRHRLPGYAGILIGKWAEQIATLSLIFGFFGSLLIYGILGGSFLKQLSGYVGSADILSLIFFIVSPLILHLDLRRIGWINFLLTVPLLLFVVLLGIIAFPHISFSNWQYTNNSQWFFPYGVFLFSFAGISAIPEVAEMLRKREGRLFEKIVALGSVIPVVVYGVFIFAVIGVSGLATSGDAIAGLTPFLGIEIIQLGALIGFLAVFTSYITLGLDLQNTLHIDYRFGKMRAWVAVFAVPLLLFLLGAKDLISTINIVGGVMGGVSGMVILLMALSVRKHHTHPKGFIPIGKIVPVMLICLFAFGVVWQLFTALAA